jgi:predicted nuclease of predicted toxin-antitoxin system
MKFLLDQNTDSRLLTYLRQLGHDATQIRRTNPLSTPDPEVLSLAYQEKRVLITGDRDFGEWVFRFKHPHAGVIFLRLGTYTPLELKIERINYVLTHYADQLDQFLVVKKGNVRVAHPDMEEL